MQRKIIAYNEKAKSFEVQRRAIIVVPESFHKC